MASINDLRQNYLSTHKYDQKRTHKRQRPNHQIENPYGTRARVKRNPTTEFHYQTELEVDQTIIDKALAAYYKQHPEADWLH
jgi:hypothetical protein